MGGYWTIPLRCTSLLLCGLNDVQWYADTSQAARFPFERIYEHKIIPSGEWVGHQLKQLSIESHLIVLSVS